MAEDDTDRAYEQEAERRAEIQSELERTDQDPDLVAEGRDQLGKQNALIGEPREGAEDASDRGDE